MNAKNYTVRLTQAEHDAAKKIGGSVSRGLRVALGFALLGPGGWERDEKETRRWECARQEEDKNRQGDRKISR